MVTPAIVSDPVAVPVEPLVLDVSTPAPAPAPAVETLPAVAVPSITVPVSTEPLATPSPSVLPRDLDGASEVVSLRRQLADLMAERETQATEARVTQEARLVQQEALARGMSEDDATWVAQRHYTSARAITQEQQRLKNQQQYLKDKQDYAAWVGKQHGVDATLLMTGNTPEDMVAIAEREKRYSAQETRLKALEQARVQPQTMDVSAGSRAGQITANSDNIDKLWLEYEIAHPGANNPYEPAYRKFLAR